MKRCRALSGNLHGSQKLLLHLLCGPGFVLLLTVDGSLEQGMGGWEWSRSTAALLPVSSASPCSVDKVKMMTPWKHCFFYPEAHDFPSQFCKMRNIILIFHIGPYSSGQEACPSLLQKFLPSKFVL